jgi:hypothetical protein
VARLRRSPPRGRPPVANYIPLHSAVRDARWDTCNTANRAGLAFRALIAGAVERLYTSIRVKSKNWEGVMATRRARQRGSIRFTRGALWPERL